MSSAGTRSYRDRQAWLRAVVATAVVAGLALAPVAIAGGSPPKPAVVSFKVVPATLVAAGGKVTLTLSVRHATKCTFASKPRLVALPTTVACASGTASHKVRMPKNSSGSVETYTFSVKVSGPGGSGTAKPAKVTVLPAPVISSFTATPSNLTPGGGIVTLKASVKNATTCVFSSVAFGVSAPCASGVATKSTHLPSNTTSSREAYTFLLTAVGRGGSIQRRLRVYVASFALVWSAPRSVDPGAQPPNGGLTSVSCANSTLCVAVDSKSDAVTWNGKSWSAPHPIDRRGLVSVSCPTSSFCAAVDGHGNVVSWNGKSWSTPQSIDPDGEFTSVMCPSSSFCAAVDLSGDALTWDGKSWSKAHSIDPSSNLGLASVSCATNSFCAAVDNEGNAIIWDGKTWSRPESIDASSQLAGVSCATRTFCVVVDADGNALTWDGKTWSTPRFIDPGGSILDSVSCPTSSFCLAGDDGGDVLTWSDKFSSSWVGPQAIIDENSGTLTSLACPTSSFCAAVDSSGNAVIGTSGA